MKSSLNNISIEKLQQICNESISYADIARKLGCLNYDGSIITTIKNLLITKNIKFETYQG